VYADPSRLILYLCTRTRVDGFYICVRCVVYQAADEAAAESDDEEEAPPEELKPNPKLEAGKKLPPTLEDFFLPEHIGRPLEDIDEFYQNKKVCVAVVVAAGVRGWGFSRVFPL